MYKFISTKNNMRKTMELVCIYHFGVQEWAEKISPYITKYNTANEKFDVFLKEAYNEISKNYNIIKTPCDSEDGMFLYTVLSDREINNEFSYVDYDTAYNYCDSISSNTKITVKNVYDDFKVNGFDEYIGIHAQDESNGKTYVYFYNKEYDDVNYCMDIFNIRTSGICNAIMLCLTGKKYEKKVKI